MENAERTQRGSLSSSARFSSKTCVRVVDVCGRNRLKAVVHDQGQEETFPGTGQSRTYPARNFKIETRCKFRLSTRVSISCASKIRSNLGQIHPFIEKDGREGSINPVKI